MIHILLPDTEAGNKMAQALLANGCALAAESDSSLQLASVDERMKRALDGLRQEHLLLHGYDYVWIMRYVNEEHIKPYVKLPTLFFSSVQHYLTYVTQYMGHDGIAGLSTLSQYYSSGQGRYPEWTFSDTADAAERLRRVNLARRFAVLFIKGC